jgi:hypothetical protein
MIRPRGGLVNKRALQKPLSLVLSIIKRKEEEKKESVPFLSLQLSFELTGVVRHPGRQDNGKLG